MAETYRSKSTERALRVGKSGQCSGQEHERLTKELEVGQGSEDDGLGFSGRLKRDVQDQARSQHLRM